MEGVRRLSGACTVRGFGTLDAGHVVGMSCLISACESADVQFNVKGAECSCCGGPLWPEALSEAGIQGFKWKQLRGMEPPAWLALD